MDSSENAKAGFTRKIIELTQAINNNPHDKQAFFQRATAYLALHDYRAALADINKVIELDGDNIDAHGLRATLQTLVTASNQMLSRSDNANTQVDLTQVAQAHYSYGLALEQAGDLEAALVSYNRSIAINNRIPVAFYRHGLVMFKLHDFVGAIPYLARAYELKPDYWSAIVLEGLCHARQQDFDSALRLYNHVIEQKPDNATAYSYRAFVKLRVGDVQSALSDAERAINLKRDEVGYWANRGTIVLELSNYYAALDDFTQALNLKSADCSTLAGLAVTHHAMGNKDEANRYWQDLLKLDSRYGDMDWLQKELNWADALVEEARKLVAELPPH